MANHLSNAQISALLSRNVSSLKPGELKDLEQALESRKNLLNKVPDKIRTDAVLNTILPTTTTTTSTSTTSTTTHTTTSTTT